MISLEAETIECGRSLFETRFNGEVWEIRTAAVSRLGLTLLRLSSDSDMHLLSIDESGTPLKAGRREADHSGSIGCT